MRRKGKPIMTRAKKSKISVLNWMGTLALCAIPGVNLIAVICFLIFGKASSKKTFALALLLWMLIFAAAVVAVIALMPDQVAQWAEFLRAEAAKRVAEASASVPF